MLVLSNGQLVMWFHLRVQILCMLLCVICLVDVILMQLIDFKAPLLFRGNSVLTVVLNVLTLNSHCTLPKSWSTTWRSEIQTNYIGIDIVCELTRVESYKQQATLNGTDVLSNVGVQTGPWIGTSFLSLPMSSNSKTSKEKKEWNHHQINNR